MTLHWLDVGIGALCAGIPAVFMYKALRDEYRRDLGILEEQYAEERKRTDKTFKRGYLSACEDMQTVIQEKLKED